ncbi:hypothetical protein BO71DRAFT_430153 [Aspergillus ellipticus CBS 707.79]|uniref:Uncharacterized protein n=1 Tax=Aspergillus ellipticus CBS 707.79 TaxID=1448320 RepID=A0A319DA87_9EURO|nr:hypothetical protein BO71DRAFT_430153 [Aspergillus ellipticus CBS 707.79]
MLDPSLPSQLPEHYPEVSLRPAPTTQVLVSVDVDPELDIGFGHSYRSFRSRPGEMTLDDPRPVQVIPGGGTCDAPPDSPGNAGTIRNRSGYQRYLRDRSQDYLMPFDCPRQPAKSIMRTDPVPKGLSDGLAFGPYTKQRMVQYDYVVLNGIRLFMLDP